MRRGGGGGREVAAAPSADGGEARQRGRERGRARGAFPAGGDERAPRRHRREVSGRARGRRAGAGWEPRGPDAPWSLVAGAAAPRPSMSEAGEEQPMETTGATENGHEAAPEGESPAGAGTGAAAGAGGGSAAPPAGNQNGAEGDQINASKNEEDAG